MTLYADEVFHHLLTLGQKSEILNLLPMAAYVVRSDGVVIWYNERAAALWGRRPDAGDTDERFCGAHTLYHADGSHMAHCDTPVALALQTGVSVHQEEVIIGRPDKSRVHVSVYIDPIRNPENGEIIGVVNFFHDLTERKRQEAERDSLLREAEARSGELRKAREELESKVKERTISLQQLSARLMSVQDDERRHIARELHDSIGQYLMALGLTLTQLERAKPSNVPARFAECKEILTRCVDETRTLSYLLHPPLLDEIGLESATKIYVEEFARRSGVEIDILLALPNRLPAETELLLFRVLQEALTNIHRHSGSKTASVRLSHEGGILLLEVEDYGKGISPERLAQIQSQGSGVGIRGMRERLRPFHGKLLINSNPSGTTISVTLSIANVESPRELRYRPLPATSAGLAEAARG